MPCYCDTPDSDDQVEIERRCKENMYFDACSLLTKEQAQECERRGVKAFPGSFNEGLCKLCKVLTELQMKSVVAYYFQIKWPHKTLYDWYIQHCKDDAHHSKGDSDA